MKARREPECDVHLVPLPQGMACPYCVRFLEAAPDPEGLDSGARLEELERWLTASPSVPLDLLYGRIEALVGRRISVHELEDPDELLRFAQRPRRQRQWDYWDGWQ